MRVAAMFGVEGSTDAGNHRYRVFLQQKKRRKGRCDFLHDAIGMRARLAAFQQHDKFVAAQARDGVDAAQRAAQALGDLLQQQVAHSVAVLVVDLFKSVQVDEQHGQLGAVALRAPQSAVEAVQQQGAVGQARELVVLRHVLQLRLQLLVLDGGSHLSRDKLQKFLVLLGVAHRLAIALQHQCAHRAVLRQQRHTQPVRVFLWRRGLGPIGQKQGLLLTDDLGAARIGMQRAGARRPKAAIHMVRVAQLIA